MLQGAGNGTGRQGARLRLGERVGGDEGADLPWLAVLHDAMHEGLVLAYPGE